MARASSASSQGRLQSHWQVSMAAQSTTLHLQTFCVWFLGKYSINQLHSKPIFIWFMLPSQCFHHNCFNKMYRSTHLYSDGQRKHKAELISLRALRRRLVKDIGGATSFIPIEWEISYYSSFFRHPERMRAKHWLRRWLATISWDQ